VIFGLLNIINFTHGAQYMMGAFVAYLLLTKLGHRLLVGAAARADRRRRHGVVIERLMLLQAVQARPPLRPAADLRPGADHRGRLPQRVRLVRASPTDSRPSCSGGTTSASCSCPTTAPGSSSPRWCLPGTWFVIERTKLGAYLRAATENPQLVQAFGINVPRMITLTYGFGVGLAALAGVLAAPIYQVSPQMGANLIIVVFAVVVIGGMGSILGSIVTGFGLGVIEGLTKVFYPEASNTVIFVIMAIVLLVARRPVRQGRNEPTRPPPDRLPPPRRRAAPCAPHRGFAAGLFAACWRSRPSWCTRSS
jgi:branched-chain amino acid transport system permease protein